jgi:hypothetical protein
MALIFISYRREDSAGYAGRLHESLERRLGEGEVFRDVDALEPGQDFVDAIAARLRDCGACLVLIGREWLEATDASQRRRLDGETDYVRVEVAAALARSDLLVVPVLVEGMLMPGPEQLPDSIRALARRHAVSLRDDTWDADVDRLVTAVRKALGRRPDPQTGPVARQAPSDRKARGSLKWVAAAGLVVAALVGSRLSDEERRSGEEGPSARVEGASTPPPREGSGAASVAGPAQAIAVPRLAETAHGRLIYTLLAAGIARHSDVTTLRLRFRLSNEGNTAANFWDSSFRLAIPGQEMAPTSGLNEVVPGYSLQQGVISFDVPAEAEQGTLKIRGPGPTAELPLQFRPTGSPSAVDRMDTRDAMSHAAMVTLADDVRPLAAGTNITWTLAAVTARRFVNVLRIRAEVRVANRGRSAWYFGTDAARLLVNGQPVAPVDGPGEVLAGDTTSSGAYVFDVPPPTRHVTLRITGESVAEAAFDVPPRD